MRKIIAKRLLESKLTLPHSYMAIEIEMDNLMATRAKFNKQNSSKVVLADSSICSVDLDTDFMIDIDCPALLTSKRCATCTGYKFRPTIIIIHLVVLLAPLHDTDRMRRSECLHRATGVGE